ncbi:unnamed protein product [Durusdinium trenchii]|uniref:Protein RFT1 homolog n=1 Tax=Durusdinium trenchii TaxID=1381693 RepID=A0ABP0T114_9DINO
MGVSAVALTLINLGVCPSLAYEIQGQEADASALETEMLLRKEPRQFELLEADSQAASQSTQSPSSDFDSSSGLWREIRKRAKITAEEPFSAEGPPAVVYSAQTASAAATIIMGMTTAFMGLFCLTQANHPPLQQATWKTLNSCLSFFSALLVYYLVREITNLMVTDEMVAEEASIKGLRRGTGTMPAMAHSGTGAVLVALLRFFLSLILQQSLLVLGRQRKVLVSVTYTFGAQLVGMLGADAFASWQEAPSWTASPAASFGLVCITILILAFVFSTARFLRSKVSDADDELKEKWRQSDSTIVSMTISLTLLQFWRFVLAGRLPHFSEIQRSEYKNSETAYLFVTLPFLLLMILLEKAFSLVQAPAEGTSGMTMWMHHALAILSLMPRIFAFASAWCALFCAKWLDYGILMQGELASAGDVMKGEMYTAMIMTGIGFACSLLFNLWCEKMPGMSCFLALLSEVCCFLVSLSWDSTFQMACAFSKDQTKSNFDQVFARCTQCQWMCIVLIPSWLFFVHPRAQAEENGPKDGAEVEKDAKGASQKPAEKLPESQAPMKEEPKEQPEEQPKEQPKAGEEE